MPHRWPAGPVEWLGMRLLIGVLSSYSSMLKTLVLVMRCAVTVSSHTGRICTGLGSGQGGAEGPIKALRSKFDSLACLPSLGQNGCPSACKALPSLKLPVSHKALLHTDHFYPECRRDATEAAFTARHTLSDP